MTHRRYVPGLGHEVVFQDRKNMRRGRPVRQFAPLSLPTPTLPIDWAKTLTFPMDANDQYGDCMYAAACHMDNTWTGMNGAESTFDVQSIVRNYEQLSGGDNGLDEGTLLQGWKKGLCDNPQVTYVDALDIDTTDVSLVQAAMYLFGGIFFMFDVPDEWINNMGTGVVWDAPAQADQNNGHGVIWNGCDEKGKYKLQTWGTYVWITPAGVKQCDPSGFIVFSLRWFNSHGVAPNGFTYDQLASYWTQSGGKQLPPSPFGPPPPPPIIVTLDQAKTWAAQGINGSSLVSLTKAEAITAADAGLTANWPGLAHWR